MPLNGGVAPPLNTGDFNTPMNGQGGILKGLEFTVSIEGSLFTPVLDGFGFMGSASTTSTTIHPSGPGSLDALPGFSPKVHTGTFWYEKNGFSARISQRYRSEFRGEVTMLFSDRSYSMIQADRQTDLQLGYAVQGGAAKGLSFLFQINNLNDSPYRTSLGTAFTSGALVPEIYEKYGRQYLLGVNYRL